MKTLVLCITVLCASSVVLAQEPAMQHNTPNNHAVVMNHGGMGMGSMMMDEQHLQAMQDYMLKLQDLSNQILAEKEGNNKERLKKQQRDLMKTHHEEMMARHAGMMK